MDRRIALVGVAGLVALFLFVLTDSGPAPGDSTIAPVLSIAVEPTATSAPPVTTTTRDPVEAARSVAVAVVEEYWAALSTDGSLVGAILDVSPEDFTREVGLAEYSDSYGGIYEADCAAGVIVEDEVIVDCTVEVLDEPLAAAFEIGATPTQFRVRDGKISRVGYLKPYSTIDLALSAHAARTDPAGFSAACTDPEGIYQSEAGVVYNGACGEYMASLVTAALAEVRSTEACGEDCDAALLNAIRPSKD